MSPDRVRPALRRRMAAVERPRPSLIARAPLLRREVRAAVPAAQPSVPERREGETEERFGLPLRRPTA